MGLLLILTILIALPVSSVGILKLNKSNPNVLGDTDIRKEGTCLEDPRVKEYQKIIMELQKEITEIKNAKQATASVTMVESVNTTKAEE